MVDQTRRKVYPLKSIVVSRVTNIFGGEGIKGVHAQQD
jgi:hypothetical protein